MEYFAPFWEGFRAIAARVPFGLWGVGYCDLKHGSSRADAGLLAGIVQRSRLCIVRDALTHAHLRQCLLPAPVPCPALNAVPAAGGATPRLLHVDHFSVVGGEVYEFMCRTAEKFAEETGRSYRQTNNLLPAGNAGALARTLDLYASADLVLTSRLHGCILALAMGRRVLAVSGDHKVESFMRAAGLGEWVCDLADIASLPERLGALPAQPVPRDFVEAARRANVTVAAQVRSLLAQTQTALTGS